MIAEAPRQTWPALVAGIERIEREEASFGLRIVNVAANATQLPVADDKGQCIHPGRFSGWHVREAIFDDAALAAVIGLSDGSSLGLTVDGSVVEVVHG